MNRHSLLVMTLIALAGCGSEAPPPSPEPAKPAPTILDDQMKAIDKAKTVEDIGMEHKRKIDEQMDGG